MSREEIEASVLFLVRADRGMAPKRKTGRRYSL